MESVKPLYPKNLRAENAETTSETIPTNGKNITYTTGCP